MIVIAKRRQVVEDIINYPRAPQVAFSQVPTSLPKTATRTIL